MKILATLSAMAIMAMAPTDSKACDPATPGCAAVNQLLEKLGYRDRLLDGQRQCVASAGTMSPEAMAKAGANRLLFLKKDGPGWSEAIAAHERLVASVCGGEEVVQLLQNFYRNEWMSALSEPELRQVAMKGQPVDKALVARVNAAAGRKAAALLALMHERGFAEYERELSLLSEAGKKVRVGEMCPNGELDERTQMCKSKR